MRRKALDANTFQNNAVGIARPAHKLDQYGFQADGPIYFPKILKKDAPVRLFYSGAYEGYKELWPQFLRNSYPANEMRTGDFSELLGTNLFYGASRPIIDPQTITPTSPGTPFPGNIIPAARISPIVSKIINLTPLPNLEGLSNNFYATGPFTFDRRTIDTKINYNASPKLSMFGRFGMLHYSDYAPQVFGDALGGPPISAFGGNPGHGQGNTYSLTAAATYVLTPTFVIDAYFGWTQAQTTSRYAHLSADPLRELNDAIGVRHRAMPVASRRSVARLQF